MERNSKLNRVNASSQEVAPAEFSFEAGVTEAVKRIRELLKTLKRDVFVVINGSRIEVGKSYLLSSIQGALMSLGIDTEHTLTGYEPGKIQKVVFSTKQGLTCKSDTDYPGDFSNPELPDGTFADLYVGIYCPGKRFSLLEGDKPVADIMIRNEQVKNDPNKL